MWSGSVSLCVSRKNRVGKVKETAAAIVRSILIVFAHPAFEKSRVNRALVSGVDKVAGVTFHDLYELYPEMDIDVKAEQRLLQAHDVVLLHYPFFLYGMPALLKEWMDLVLVHGWAFGSRGAAMRDKWLGAVVTTGGGRVSYSRDGFNRFTMRELLAPLEQTACLCGMRYLPPYVVHGTNVIAKEGISSSAADYHRMLRLLSDDAFRFDSPDGREYLNDCLNEKR